MMQPMMKCVLLALICSVCVLTAFSQEGLRPLGGRIRIEQPAAKAYALRHTPLARTQATASLDLPFLDDFYYASTNIYPDGRLWQDSTVYVNYGFPIAPPSIGVATFDGLNRHGYPHNPGLANLTLSDFADTLTSQPINLKVITSTSQNLQLSDSIAISFYYQAKGNGEAPEQEDSLLLDFYKPRQNKWVTVWGIPGNSNSNQNDTVFKRGFVWITDTLRDSVHVGTGDTAYMHADFQFRFRNKATTLGDFDHWNLDYVYLDQHRSQIADTVYNDLTIGTMPGPFLKSYSSMPYKQFIPSEMAARTSVRIQNDGGLPITMNYDYQVLKLPGLNQVSLYTGGSYSLAPFKSGGYSTYTPQANPPINYTFAVMPGGMVDYEIEHHVYRSSTGSSDFILANDIVPQFQSFQNYYALDDGSAEGGYYVYGQGGEMAVKITLNFPDTLEGLRIYFDPVGVGYSLTDTISYRFAINVWNAVANGPGLPKYIDSYVRYARYDKQYFKVMPYYELTKPLPLDAGTYYIGFQQKNSTGITVGFDKNCDHHENVYYNSGGGWTQSGFHGSIMIHPVFGAALPTGIQENQADKEQLFQVYPNPSQGQFMIASQHYEKSSYQLMNTLGQTVLSDKLTQSVQSVATDGLSDGVYFLMIRDGNNKPVQQQKLILQH